jgi:hypothetical protein
MSSTRAGLWDMDGTLIDSEEFHWISWRNTMANEGIAITHEQFLSSFGQRNNSIIPDGWALYRHQSASRGSQMPKRNFIVIWLAETASHRCPGLQVGCTGFTSKDGVKQSPQRRHVRTSKQSLKLYQPPTFFRASSLLKMCTQASRILKCI